MKKILLNCAPGVSDAIAMLLLSRSSELQITAVTTSYGRCSAERAFCNAVFLAEKLDLCVPVVQGAEKPLFGERLSEWCSADRLPALQDPECRMGSAAWAWDEIYRQAKAADGKLTILTTGPLTNLAIALFRYEDLPQYLDEVLILGGSAGSGDVTELGEYNAVSDPQAFEVVLRSGIPVRMLGLDALETARLSDEEYQQLQKRLPTPFSTLLAEQYCALQEWDGPGTTLPGAVLAAIAERPDLADSVSRSVHVETVRSSMVGRTIVDIRRHSKEPHNADVIGAIHKEAFLSWLFSRLDAGK